MSNFPLTVPDLVCLLDADAFGRETKSDLETLEQDVFHRLIEPPGSNIDDETLGVGVEQSLSAATATEIPAIERRVDRNLAKDDRIASSHTTIVPEGEPHSFRMTIKIVPTSSVTGLTLSFTFTKAGGLIPA